jgi:hypothetical protein
MVVKVDGVWDSLQGSIDRQPSRQITYNSQTYEQMVRQTSIHTIRAKNIGRGNAKVGQCICQPDVAVSTAILRVQYVDFLRTYVHDVAVSRGR